MKPRFELFDKKKKQEFIQFLKEKYGFELSGNVLKQSQEKLRYFTGNLSEHELNILAGTVRVETIGLYLATIDEDASIRFSFDAGFLAKNAKKNVIELDDSEAKQWFKGDDISLGLYGEAEQNETINPKPTSLNKSSTHTFIKLIDYPYVFLKFKNKIIGCGKLTSDKQKILNFVPKERRIKY